ncbi:MAG: glycosyltransferase family 2 protein [Candidatus Bathyarchaeota archaeon]|nr:glycosyltransferase family 2 protein [Candidatus Bathyarchaeota archaeon]
MEKKVTLGLCVKNGSRVVKTAFESISIQDYPHNLMKLVIVDNGSTDDTLSLISDFAQKTDIPILITSSKGKGLAATRQIALDYAEGDYILWVDDDLVLNKDYVRNQICFMEKNDKVGAARGFYNNFSNESVLDILDFLFLLQPKKINYIGTGGSIFRLKALKKVGGFDTKIRGAGEDIDISLRIMKSGWILATNTSARLHNRQLKTLKVLWKKNLGYGYANHFLYQKHKDLQIILRFFPPFTLLSGTKMAGKVYKLVGMRKVFVIPVINFFIISAQGLGFIRAQMDGYGPSFT